MLYNAQRQRVRQWHPGDISTCPDCQRSLFARRGEFVIWHWAHYPRSAGGSPCGHRETAWHLAWKAAYDELPDWTVEERIHGLRADAANLHTGSLREFIHCLTPYYAIKHRLLAALGFDVRWIFDGNAFGSQRKRIVSRGGISGLLTPRAHALHLELNRRCWVHWSGQLWKEWRDNVWFSRTDSAASRLVAAFEHACQTINHQHEEKAS